MGGVVEAQAADCADAGLGERGEEVLDAGDAGGGGRGVEDVAGYDAGGGGVAEVGCVGGEDGVAIVDLSVAGEEAY